MSAHNSCSPSPQPAPCYHPQEVQCHQPQPCEPAHSECGHSCGDSLSLHVSLDVGLDIGGHDCGGGWA
jgi:hypothetical protein